MIKPGSTKMTLTNVTAARCARLVDNSSPDIFPPLRPYQQRTLELTMSDNPFTIDRNVGKVSRYAEFVDRYAVRTDRPRYGGTMKDMLAQSYAAGLKMSGLLVNYWFRQTPNHIDDVFNRVERKATAMQEARLREYCWADARFTFADYATTEWRIIFTAILGYPIASPHHRLTSTYGHESGQGTNITIVYNGASPWPTRRHADMIAGAFVGYGCAPIYAKKAGDSIYGCGEYSCDVTLSKHALENLKNTMEVLDCKVFIRRPAARYKADMPTDIR